jgi:type IV pilus assembly protein PilV
MLIGAKIMHKTSPLESAQHGAVLLEAMIAILIFSMGVLAIVGLQAAMIKNTADSKYRADAGFIAQERIGQIWADPDPTRVGYVSFVEANTDISTLLPAGTRTVTQPVAGQFTVTITWTQPGAGETQHTFTTTARITGG